MRISMLLLAGSLCLTATAGFHYEATTEIIDSANKRANNTMIVEAWVQGDKAKILFRENDNPMTKPGSYMITADGGETIYLVDPENETYMEWDIDQLMQLAGAAANMIKIQFENFDSKIVEESEGDRILGKNTRRVKTMTTYDLSIRMLGMKRASSVEMEQEFWLTDELSDAAFGVWLRKKPPTSGNEELDKLMKASMEGVKGFPLRSKTKTVTKQWNKKRTKVRNEQTTHNNTEVTKLEKTNVPEGTFEIPTGYTKTENPIGGGGLQSIFKNNN